jgi:multidrug efflux pump subunit AcrA (membrane-fusion protein)
MKQEKLEIKSWEQARAAMADYAAAQNEIDKADALLAEAELTAKQVRAQMAEGYEARCADLTAALRKFARQHQAEFLAVADGGEGRTRVHSGVELGFEWGKPYIEIGKKSEASVIKRLEENAGDTYVQRCPKIRRDVLQAEIKTAKENGDQALIDKFAAWGITLEQDEEFVLRVLPTQG